MEEAAANRELPVPLLWQVLSRLPVRSLCKFRCVCKLWRWWISDPLFIEAHRACSARRAELLISFGRVPARSLDGLVDPIRREKKKEAPIRRATARPSRGCTLTPACQGGGCLMLIDGPVSHQVGGLYCLDSGTSVRLFNPDTREFFHLDAAFNPYLMKRTESSGARVRITSHFGFDPVERKHKVLTLWGAPYFDCYIFVLEDNYWTKIVDNYPPALMAPPICDVICVDGVIFSAPLSRGTRAEPLVAFDIRTGAFRVIPRPPQCEGKRAGVILREFAGRAALVRLGGGCESPRTLTLWVLEDLGQQVWSRKDCVIPGDDLGQRVRIHSGTPAGELILAPDIDVEPSLLLMYNVESNALRWIELQGLPRGVPMDSLLCLHAESLCSPKPKQAPSS